MPDLHLLSILVVDITGFVVAYHCCVVFMKRGDEGLTGVIRVSRSRKEPDGSSC